MRMLLTATAEGRELSSNILSALPQFILKRFCSFFFWLQIFIQVFARFSSLLEIMDSFCSPGIVLPPSVNEMLKQICDEQSLFPAEIKAREGLAKLGEEASLRILKKIKATRIRNLTGLILFMVKNAGNCSTQESVNCSGPPADSSSSREEEDTACSPSREKFHMQPSMVNDHLRALGHLEFRRAFLILSYIREPHRLEDRFTVDQIYGLKDLPMVKFELEVWKLAGRHCIDASERKKLDWDSEEAHMYHCHVDPTGKYTFQGPFLDRTRTHLQKVLGDDHVLVVKFAEVVNERKPGPCSFNSHATYHSIAKEGILVGLRRYRFFVFKDGGKEEKKKNPSSSRVKCYFVCTESCAASDEGKPSILFNKSIQEARRVFMDIHTISTLAKYMPRFSLILSKTVKLDVDLSDRSDVNIERINDIPCLDENNRIILNGNNEPWIHTDGTGFISMDLAMKCPRNIHAGHHLIPGHVEDNQDLAESGGNPLTSVVGRYFTSNPPLLIQFRLFYEGCAVKGTVLVNKRLPPNTIQIRRSMVKVESDSTFPHIRSPNSFEIVGTSNRPKPAYLSRNLIALLSHGGVPKEFFMELLMNALNDMQNMYCNRRAALTVSLRLQEIDRDFLVTRMISCGIPLEEPHLQNRLSVLLREERSHLKQGRLQLSDCFYLMGTADPTGKLKSNEVCVIMDHGQISGDVLVYKNPGLHFGDIHVFSATPIKDLEAIVGDSKYAIFFSTQGSRSGAEEIANSDFDGDMYWISRNQKLLDCFKTSEPWEHPSPEIPMCQPKPTQFSDVDLEKELFQLFLDCRFKPSYAMSTASDSWLAFMDRFLTLGDECADEKDCLKEKMLQLVDVYYDALDAPKSGKKVEVPNHLRSEKFPHFMEKNDKYVSKSILGLIYDEASSYSNEDLQAKEIWLLPCFDEEISQNYMVNWKQHYEKYRTEMCEAMNNQSKESKDAAADEVIRNYKQILYGAPEFEESRKSREEIFNEARAIYQISYKYAKEVKDVGRCSFAWNVAGRALCELYSQKHDKSRIVCSPSVLRELVK